MNYQLDNINIYSKSIKELEKDLLNILSSNKSKQIITLNLDFFRNSKFNDEFRFLCENTELVLPDGSGITSLIKIKYGKRIKRITGHDLFTLILKISDNKNLRIALLGSTENVLRNVKNKIKKGFPKIVISKMLSPENNFEKDKFKNDLIIKSLMNSKPEILIVALGSPRQDLWLKNYKDEIGAKINVGLGSVFDYYSGIKKRCPLFLQKLKLEWFWRLLSEPARLFRRYIINDLPFYIKEVLKLYKNKSHNI